MPWTTKNPPRPAKNWSSKAKRACVSAANGTLKSGGSEEDAIRACIGAAKRADRSSIKAPKKEWKGRKHDDVSALAFTAGFYALPRIELGDASGRNVSTLQVLPQGKFKHPWYGDLDFTEPMLRQMQRNFDRKTLGVDIMVDENHDRGKALGWFKAIKHRSNHEINGVKYAGLFAEIEWTDEGRSLLERDVYRYFSAEVGSYVGPDGKKVPNVVFGGGLTNRPFFKQMPAVKFEEGTAEDRFLIGLFDDDLWAFNDIELTEEDDDDDGEETRTFYAGFSTDEGDTQDEDEDGIEEHDMSYEDLINRINRGFGTSFGAENEDEAATAVLAAFGDSKALKDVRKKFTDAGFTFSEDADVAEVVLAGYNALKNQNTENTESIRAIRKELDDTKAANAVDKLVESGKLVPAKRDSYIKLFGTNQELFEELTKDLQPVVQLGEIGGDGVPQEPGHAKEGEFKDPVKAKEEAERYMQLVPSLEERLTNGRNS